MNIPAEIRPSVGCSVSLLAAYAGSSCEGVGTGLWGGHLVSSVSFRPVPQARLNFSALPPDA